MLDRVGSADPVLVGVSDEVAEEGGADCVTPCITEIEEERDWDADSKTVGTRVIVVVTDGDVDPLIVGIRELSVHRDRLLTMVLPALKKLPPINRSDPSMTNAFTGPDTPTELPI
jgi:hypothetical protein